MASNNRKSNETRERLLSAALEVMSRKGYAEATVSEIAQEAGVSKGLAYYHFKSKGQLATEILRTSLEGLIVRFESISLRAESGSQALRDMLADFSELVAGNWQFGRFYLSALWRDGRVWSQEMRDVENRLVCIVAEQFARAQREGAVRAGDDPEFDAVSCIGLILTCSMRYFGMDDETARTIDVGEFQCRVESFVKNATHI